MRNGRGIEKPKKDQFFSARAFLRGGVFFSGRKTTFFAQETV